MALPFFPRFGPAARLCALSALCLGSAAWSGPQIGPDSLEFSRAKDAYRFCAMVHLPPDFKGIKSASAAVGTAVNACNDELMVVAGTIALENPGEKDLRQKISAIKKKVMVDLVELVQESQPR